MSLSCVVFVEQAAYQPCGSINHPRSVSVELFPNNNRSTATGSSKLTTRAVNNEVATGEVACDSSKDHPSANSDHAANLVYLQQLGLSDVIGLAVAEQPTASTQSVSTVLRQPECAIKVEPVTGLKPPMFYGSRKRKPTAPYSPSEDVGEKGKQARRPMKVSKHFQN